MEIKVKCPHHPKVCPETPTCIDAIVLNSSSAQFNDRAQCAHVHVGYVFCGILVIQVHKHGEQQDNTII